MIRHIGINVHDLAKAKFYYDNLLPSLGFEPHIVAEDQFAYRPSDNPSGPAIFFYPALEDARYSRHKPGLQHLAFTAESRSAVNDIYDKAQLLGSEIIYPPQLFPQYRPHYFATFWLDPEGIMLEAVCLTENNAD